MPMPLSLTDKVKRAALDATRERDVAARIGVFGGVRQKIGKHLGETQRIRIEGHGLRRAASR